MGINFLSSVIFFREQWANESVWYAIVNVNDKKEFEYLLTQNLYQYHYDFKEDYAVVQMTPSSEPEKIKEHLFVICHQKIKSFDAKVDLSETFSEDHHIHLFYSPKNPSHVSDGYVYIDFLEESIEINGELDAVTQAQKLPFIQNLIDTSSTLSLRSAFPSNLDGFGIKTDSLTNAHLKYEQLNFDYKGTDLLIGNNNIPVTAYPNVNSLFTFYDSTQWQLALIYLDVYPQVKVDLVNKKLHFLEGAHTVLNFDLNDTTLAIFQNKIEMSPNINSPIYFDFYCQPGGLVSQTKFVEDENNPPGFVASIKISVMQSVLEEMNFMDQMSEIHLQLSDSENNGYKVKGFVHYQNKNGHSIIESLNYLMQLEGVVPAAN